jgi:DNA polymerase-3 subunit epsilon
VLRRILRRRSPPEVPSAAAEPESGVGLASIAAGADRIVVIDTETTGVYPSDRVVEVAVVTMALTGAVVDEWETLVDPERDVGPSWLHGVSASMIIGAPTFDQIAGSLAIRLQNAAIAAHNLPFDARMLHGEYARLGVDADLLGGFDTLRATGCKLHVACERHGVAHGVAHRAIHDARATAQLLMLLADSLQPASRPAAFFTPVPPDSGRCRPRDDDALLTAAPPGWLAALAARLDHSSAEPELRGYLDVLDRAMADLHLDAAERAGLRALAEDLGLDRIQTERANRRWLDDFIATACADGVVDAEEYDQLCRAAAVLGLDQDHVDRRMARQRTSAVAVALAGAVCFTGEPVDPRGRPIPRSRLEAHAGALGLKPVGSVTKSGCDLLVAADPASSSGKAAKARRYGVTIVSAADFLAARGGDSLVGSATTVGGLETLVCASCGRAWTRPRSAARRPALCEDCDGRRGADTP